MVAEVRGSQTAACSPNSTSWQLNDKVLLEISCAPLLYVTLAAFTVQGQGAQ